MSSSDGLDIGGSAYRFPGLTLHPAEDRGWVHVDAALVHYLGEITVADGVFTVPAHAQQDDLDRKATALEDRQEDGPLGGVDGFG
jgi:hypothetical protein